MDIEQRVRESFFEQANYCERLGSRFMASLMSGLGEHLDFSTESGKRILTWQGQPEPKADALALRLAGGLHALARSGANEALAAIYQDPDLSVSSGFLPEIMTAIEMHDADLAFWLDFAPQTNEVARASVIYAGLCVIANRFGLPLALHEIGCSGGLNLLCAEFGYSFAGKKFGQPGSLLQLEPEWEGSLPPSVQLEIISRNGCDLNPLFVENSEDASKLVAYLWPDQPARIARVEAAIEIAKANPSVLEKADAAGWVERKILTDDSWGNVRVLYDTIAWNYFPHSTKASISNHMQEIGEQATAENPLCWLTFEFDEEDKGPFLKLRAWPGNGNVEILASADPHVYSIEWMFGKIK